MTANVNAGSHGTVVMLDEPGLTIELPVARDLRKLLIGLDATAAAAAWLIALAIPALLGGEPAGRVATAVVGAIVAALASMALIAGHRLYLARVCSVKAVEIARLGRVSALSGLLLFLAADVMGVGLAVERVAVGALLAFLLLMFSRAGYRSWLSSRRRHGVFSRPVVIVGANEEAADLHRLVEEHPESGFHALGFIAPAAQAAGLEAPWLGEPRDAAWAIRASGATGALVAASALAPSELNRLVRELIDSGIHVHLSNGVRGIAHHRVRAMPLAHEPLFYLEPACLSRWQLVAKRALDLVLGGMALVALAPVFAVAAAAVKLHDGGPALFRQQRVGLDGRLFTLYKLRTMVTDAEARLDTLKDDNQRDGGPLFKLAADPRVTPVGRLLRATSIDELPQLLNVLAGDMSLVGPRPALPDEVEQFDDRTQNRSRVLPGITGLWQVEARDNPSFWSYQRLDLFYVENWSVGLDLSILLSTVAAVTARGVRAVVGSQPGGDIAVAGVLE